MGYGPFGMPGAVSRRVRRWYGPVVPGRRGGGRRVRAGNEPSVLLGVLPDTREALALDQAEC